MENHLESGFHLNCVGFQVRQIDKAVGKMEDMFGEEELHPIPGVFFFFISFTPSVE